MTIEQLIAKVSDLKIDKELKQEIVQNLAAPRIYGTAEHMADMADGNISVIQQVLSDAEIAEITEKATLAQYRSNSIQLTGDSLESDPFLRSLIGATQNFEEPLDFNDYDKLGKTQDAIINIPEPVFELKTMQYGEMPQVVQTGITKRQVLVEFVANNNGVIVANVKGYALN